MILNFFSILFIIFLFFSFNSLQNPLNFSVKLTFLTIVLFFHLYILTSRWFPLILSMLILGGILVIFSVLSSLIPNEKIVKEKYLFFFFRLILRIFLFLLEKLNYFPIFKMNKSFIEEYRIFFLIISIILFYFFRFVSIISLQEGSMRKFTCFKKIKFCKF